MPQSKVDEYLAAGVDVVWLVYPEVHRALFCAAGRPVDLLGNDGSLIGEGQLQGFACPLAALWPRPRP